MAGFWFIILGVLAAWLLPGAAAAAWCLLSKDLRRRALQLHKFSAGQAVIGYVRANARKGWRGPSEDAIQLWRRVQEQRRLQLILIALVLTLSGPRAFARVRCLRRSRSETRLE